MCPLFIYLTNILPRDDPKKNRIVRLCALSDTADSIVCPLKLLLIVALTTGAVEEISLAALVKRTSESDSRKVLWTHGTRPVIAAMTSSGGLLLLEKPAHGRQILHTIEDFGLRAGSLEQMAPSDIRRFFIFCFSVFRLNKLQGATAFTKFDFKKIYYRRDGAAITVKQDKPTFAAARSLGHSRSSHLKGVTDGYVGPSNIDTWTPRLNVPDDETFAIKPTAKPYKKRRRAAERNRSVM